MLTSIKKFSKRIAGAIEERRCLASLRPEDRDLITRIREKKLTYLSVGKLASIADACRDAKAANLDGVFLEAGCALGGSSILMASVKEDERPLFIYDVFGMIPPPTEEDTEDVQDRYQTIVEGKSKGIGGDKYYGYEENLYEVVQANLKSFSIDCDRQSVALVKGLVQDTLHLDQPVALAHVDVDWYEPVMTCLERVFPKLVPGGSIILDDYHVWGGCRKATDEYLKRIEDQFELDDSAGSMKVIKK